MLDKIFFPLKAAISNKYLVYGFVQREIKGRFAGNMAGMAWALLNPLATLLVYMFVFSIVLRVGVTAEETGTDIFFVYFVTGFVPWLIFADSLTRATNSILDNSSIVTKVLFPVELLPLTSMLSSLLVNGLGIILLGIYLSFVGFLDPHWAQLLFIIPVHLLFIFGMSLLLSALCVYIRDLREMLPIILMIWFFSTPVIYPLSMVPEHIQTIIHMNPMFIFVTLYRGAWIQHDLDFSLLICSLLISLLTYFAGVLFFARVKPGFGDVL